MINRLIPEIISVIIPPIDQTITNGVVGSGDTLHACRTILSKDIITDTAHSTVRVFWTPADVIRHGMDRNTTQDCNTDIQSTRLTSPVRIGSSTTVSPTRTGSQDIISPRGSIGPQEVRDAQLLYTSISLIYAKHR